MLKRTLSALALAALATGAAHAQLTFSGGTDLTNITLYNPTGTTTTQTQGKRNSLIDTGAGGSLTATFLGFEADHTDTFVFSFGSGTLTNNSSSLGASISGPVAAGGLNFTFADMTSGASVGNGGTAGFASYAVFGTFAAGAGSAFTPYTMGGLYDLVIGFNDSLTVDGDYDDMVVGLKLTPAVPEPETYALMLAGLGAVAYMSRRRKQQA